MNKDYSEYYDIVVIKTEEKYPGKVLNFFLRRYLYNLGWSKISDTFKDRRLARFLIGNKAL